MRTKIFGIFLAVCALGVLGFFVHRMWDEKSAVAFNAATAASVGSVDVVEPASNFKPHRAPLPGQQEFYDQQYRFSVMYPSDLAIKIYDEGGGASTIAFQNTTTVEGFQLFITPYASSTVSAERFTQDEPSGVRQSPRDVTVDGAAGSSFYGSNSALGDTAEIWFIHGGFLYEVTAPKSQAAWLSKIMATWQFI